VTYSGTEYESQWRPRTVATRLLRRPTDCSPCYAFKCPYQKECLDIPAEEVVAEAMAMLETNYALGDMTLLSTHADVAVQADC
jgi:hypothetical protein